MNVDIDGDAGNAKGVSCNAARGFSSHAWKFYEVFDFLRDFSVVFVKEHSAQLMDAFCFFAVESNAIYFFL